MRQLHPLRIYSVPAEQIHRNGSKKWRGVYYAGRIDGADQKTAKSD